jgi:hypothetical protein
MTICQLRFDMRKKRSLSRRRKTTMVEVRNTKCLAIFAIEKKTENVVTKTVVRQRDALRNL